MKSNHLNQIRILYLSDNAGLGGGETFLINHLEQLCKRQYYPVVVCPAEGELTRELRNIGITVRIVYFKPLQRTGIFFRYPFLSAIRLFRLMKTENIDLVNSNGFNSMCIAAPAAKALTIPFIWTCHGWWHTGRLTGAFINRFTDKIITISGFVKDKLINEGCVDPCLIEQIPAGIDISKYRRRHVREIIRRQFNVKQDEPLIGMIGRFQEIKGHHIFVQMAAELLRSYPNARFIIVGSSVFGTLEESDYAHQIHEQILRLGLKSRIILTGFRRDIPELLESIDILVVPSKIETFGMVILEAMAMGVPVVSCAKGGPREIIQHGENGYILDNQDTFKLSEQVGFLIKNPSIRSRMGENGQKTVAENYRIQDIVTKTQSLYENLMEFHQCKF